MSEPGVFCLVLHAHIPYVLGHGTWPHGSRMLYDAAADTYLPLIRLCRELLQDGVRPAITISITPVLAEQLADDRFKEWFPPYLRERAELAEANEAEFRARGDLHLAYLASRWANRYWELHRFFCEDLGHDIIGAFRQLQDAGAIEVMTSAATHGYLALLREDTSIQAQVRTGIHSYLRHFGRWPRGFWLPECAYRPRCRWAPPAEIQPPDGHTWPRKAVHEFLAENGIDYFIVDTHMLERAGDPLAVDIHYEDTLGKLWGRITRRDEPPRPSYEKTPYFAYFVGELFEDYPPVACLVRNRETSQQVWSRDVGYPGDFWYLEFHKKHIPGDHRYWRVTDDTGDLEHKQPYDPDIATSRVWEHAGHFVAMIHDILEAQPRPFGRRPVICAPFDAELFGHWWFEGLEWLKLVLRWIHADPRLEALTCREYLQVSPPATAIVLPEGSWGAGGGHYMWLNDQTAWSWQRIYDAELEMQALAQHFAYTEDQQLMEFLKQAARELLLLQASDWQFMITTGYAPDVAAARLVSHHSDFKRVADLARRWARHEWLSDDDWAFFGQLRDRNRPFPDVDPRWFAYVDYPAS